MRIVKLSQESRQNLLENLLKRSPGNYGQYQDTVQQILVSWEEIRFWRKAEDSMKCWILAMENAACVYVDRNQQGSFYSIRS